MVRYWTIGSMFAGSNPVAIYYLFFLNFFNLIKKIISKLVII